MERSEIQWGHSRIAYQIQRSARRSTVSLAVDPAEGLLVTAPSAASMAQLDRVVRAKARWIVAQLARVAADRPPARELVSGETFAYLGRQYRLRVSAGEPRVAMRAGWIELVSPRDAALAERRAQLVAWYMARARERLPGWARALGAGTGDVVVTDQSRRWGSCSRGVLRLNWRIMQAPRSIVEYVLAHEIVHLDHPHHGPRFWAALGRRIPDYEQRKERLRQLGPALVW